MIPVSRRSSFSDSGSQSGLAPHRPAQIKFMRHMFLEASLVHSSLPKLPAMSPAIAQAGAGAASKDVKKESATARLLGSGMETMAPGFAPTLEPVADLRP